MRREPSGGAHRNYDEAAKLLRESIETELVELEKMSPDQLIDSRIEKYENMGFYEE